MSAHTPGPWTVFHDSSPGILYVKTADGQQVAGPFITQAIGLVFADFMRRTADAALIARAPDLLAEVAALRAELERARANTEKLRAVAIERADTYREQRNEARLRVEALEKLRTVVVEVVEDYESTITSLAPVVREFESIKRFRAALEVKP